MRRRWDVLAVVAVAVLAYANAFGHEFVYDDVILADPRATSLARVGESFLTPYWGVGSHTGLYRPLPLVTYALNHALGGLDPSGYTLVNVALHALCSVLVLALGASCGAGRRASFAGAALFALHPVHVEAVTWTVGRAELLCAALGLLALLGARRAQAARGGAAWRWRGAAAAALFGALLSKEHAVALVGVIPLVGLLAPPRGARARIDGPGLLLALAALGAYLALRALALEEDAWGLRAVTPLDNPLVPLVRSRLGNTHAGTSGAGERLAGALVAASECVRLVLWPARLSVDYSFAQVVAPGSALDPRVLIGGGGCLLVAGGAVGLRQRAPAAAAGLALSAVTFALTSNAVLLIGTVCAERLLYLPSVGLCLAAGVGWSRLARARRGRALALALALVVPFLATLRVRARNPEWRDRYTLWTSAVRDAPRSARAKLKLGQIFLVLGDALAARGRADEREGALRQASQLLEASLAIYPEGASTNVEAARARRLLGDARGALAFLARAEVLAGGVAEPAARLERGLAWAALGDPRAGDELRAALETLPPEHAWRREAEAALRGLAPAPPRESERPQEQR